MQKNLLSTGSPAPDFTAETGDGQTLTLSGLYNKSRVVLVFYPADDTTVCTKQLCMFRDSFAELEKHNCTVLGINPAGKSRHAAFAGKHGYQFPLIVDTKGHIAAEYGCRGFFGLIKRTVYVIDVGGAIIFARRGNPTVQIVLESLATNPSPQSTK